MIEKIILVELKIENGDRPIDYYLIHPGLRKVENNTQKRGTNEVTTKK